MKTLMEMPFILQVLVSIFLAILFLQSGIDKVVDRAGIDTSHAQRVLNRGHARCSGSAGGAGEHEHGEERGEGRAEHRSMLFSRHLRTNYPCILEDDRAVVFDLRKSLDSDSRGGADRSAEWADE